jgi:hypothetical protein
VIRETSRISVPAESEQAMIVRQFVRLACHRYGCDAVADNVLQVADELVGLAVARHASATQTATTDTARKDTATADTVDATGASAVPLARNADAPQGLQIVESLAVDWGVTDDDGGTTAWAEMAGEPTTSSPGEPG